jgi:DNA-binding NarL/FixJ family response regulator
LVREGLCQVLKGLDENVQVFQAPDCGGAFKLADQHPDLDLVLLDFHLPDMNGLQGLEVFGKTHPELPVVILSGSVNIDIARKVIAHGAAGFITKSGVSSELLYALRQVLAGDIYFPEDMVHLMAAPAVTRTMPSEAPSPLTPRQEAVLKLLMGGLSNKEISRSLNLSEETTKNHVTAVLRGFGVKTRVQAVLAAGERGYTKAAPSP